MSRKHNFSFGRARLFRNGGRGGGSRGGGRGSNPRSSFHRISKARNCPNACASGYRQMPDCSCVRIGTVSPSYGVGGYAGSRGSVSTHDCWFSCVIQGGGYMVCDDICSRGRRGGNRANRMGGRINRRR